ncbi:sulfotransferase [Phycisphaerales bacterium AB-hyl4]|uniref:Sulfotransferase n=1 Tax=Natronomicrosphaera hydrolytica TaxID=3242702 RepID=A0ABV4UA33_9BACT
MSESSESSSPEASVGGTLAGRLPDVIIIGAAKAGTTALAEYLRRHPSVFVSAIKEPEFFSHDENFARGMDWYRGLFADALTGQVCVEASTSYTRWPEYPQAVPRLAEALPRARFIYILRHPVERAWSHYVHRVTKELYRHEPVPATFEEHIERDPVCINSSRYMDQIEQYLPYFGRDSFLVLLNDDLAGDTAATLSRVCRFLGVEDIGPDLAKLDTSWYRNARTVDGRVRGQIFAPLKANPITRTVGRLLPKAGKDAAYQLLRRTPRARRITRQFTPPPMTADTRLRLIDYFKPHNDRLAEFIDTDLSFWDE